MSGDTMKEGILFGIGNPLLDISATVTQEYLQQYGLKSNDAILAEEKHLPIYAEISEKFKVDYIPGGATLNAIKVAQWLLQKKHATSFSGCIKDDKYGKIIIENAEKIGIKPVCQKNEGPEPTGTCAVLIMGHHRSLVTNLGAANHFKEDFISKSDVWEHVQKADYFYSAGFFLTVCPSALLKVAEHSHEAKKTFCMNLSAPFICQFFKEPMMQVLPYVDILIGNETEALTFSETHSLGTTDLVTIAKAMAALPKKNPDRPRIVIITNGSLPSIVVDGTKEHVEYPVNQLDESRIVDTNGAGDAFVGGFLSKLVTGSSLDECMRCGIWSATLIVQRSGCTFPEVPDYK